MSGASLPKKILFFLAFVAFLLEHTPLRSDVTPSSDIWLWRQIQYTKLKLDCSLFQLPILLFQRWCRFFVWLVTLNAQENTAVSLSQSQHHPELVCNTNHEGPWALLKCHILSMAVKHVHPFIATVYPSSDWCLEHDYVTRLKSCQTGFLNMHEFTVLKWHPQSPNLSPVKNLSNLWGMFSASCWFFTILKANDGPLQY